MYIYVSRKNKWKLIILIFLVPLIITLLTMPQWDNWNKQAFSIGILAVWVLPIIFSSTVIKDKDNPYPFHYLIDYDTLLKYLQEEENFCKEYYLESGFNFYVYQDNTKIKVQAWHYEYGQTKANEEKKPIYYWNNEEMYTLEALLNKFNIDNGYIFIKLIDADNNMLNEYKKKHPELNVVEYVKKYKGL